MKPSSDGRDSSNLEETNATKKANKQKKCSKQYSILNTKTRVQNSATRRGSYLLNVAVLFNKHPFVALQIVSWSLKAIVWENAKIKSFQNIQCLLLKLELYLCTDASQKSDLRKSILQQKRLGKFSDWGNSKSHLSFNNMEQHISQNIEILMQYILKYCLFELSLIYYS